MKAIAYIQGRPWLDYPVEKLREFVSIIEVLYRDTIEEETVEIRNEVGELLSLLPPRKARIRGSLRAEESPVPNSPQTVYLDQFNYVVAVL